MSVNDIWLYVKNLLNLHMIKPHRNTNHLISLTTGSIESGRVNELIHYISKFSKDLLLKQNFLDPNRYDIAAKYVESGFFTQKQFEEALSEIYEKHKATKWTNVVKSCMREYNLNKIL